MNSNIFRAYDIRGIVDKDFTSDDAVLIGQAFGTYLLQNNSRNVVIGHDNRFSSDELNAHFIRGLIKTGVEVTDIGLALTPMLHFAVIKHGFDAGVIVTASHNPPEYNGFRFDGPDALPIFDRELQNIRKIMEDGKFASGEGEVRYWDIFEDYLNEYRQRIHLQRPVKVVIDCGNATASKFAPRIFETIGCQIEDLYCELDADFPYHQPDPENKLNMRDLAKRVHAVGAELGIAFDTDADRVGFVDENGTIYENDKAMIILARDILERNPGAKIIYDVKCSYVLEEEIKKAGGKPKMIRTGHPYFKKRMYDNPEILLGGELSSHTFIKDNYYGYDDGPFAGARMVEILSRDDKPFSSYFDDIEHTAHTEEIKLPTPDDKKFEIMQKIPDDFEQWELITIDGVRVKFSPRQWALIRASNTTPALSLRFEAEDDTKLHEIIEIVKARLQKYPVVDVGPLSELLKMRNPKREIRNKFQ